MIDTARRWNRRRQLSDTRGNDPVEDRDYQELVEYSWRSAVVDSNKDTSTNSWPNITDTEADTSQ